MCFPAPASEEVRYGDAGGVLPLTVVGVGARKGDLGVDSAAVLGVGTECREGDDTGVPAALDAGVAQAEARGGFGRPVASFSPRGGGRPLASATSDRTHSTVHCAMRSGS